MNKYTDGKAPMTFANAHVAWLACLGCLLHRVRCEGLMSIEWMIEEPHQEGSLLYSFPQVLDEPYLCFTTDLLRMMIGGSLDAEDMQIYAKHAVVSLTTIDYPTSGSKVDSSLLETIWLTLWASMKGYVPQVAVEFGRQAVPVMSKPTHGELEGIFREVRDTWRESQMDERNMESRIESFVESLGGR